VIREVKREHLADLEHLQHFLNNYMIRDLSAPTITLKSMFNLDDPFEKRTKGAKPSVPGDKTVPYNAEKAAIKVKENQQAYFHHAPTELEIKPSTPTTVQETYGMNPTQREEWLEYACTQYFAEGVSTLTPKRKVC
jgi:hypothetical protein